MLLIDILKTEKITAMKAKDTFVKTILTTLIGEVEIVGKNDGNRKTTDAEAIKVITKFKKGVNEILNVESDEGKCRELEKELDVYNVYLPQLMSEDELRKDIGDMIDAGLNNIGAIMGNLNKSYKGKFDGSMASKIAKELL